MDIARPNLLFLGGRARRARGQDGPRRRRLAPRLVRGPVAACPAANADAKLPDMSVAEGVAAWREERWSSGVVNAGGVLRSTGVSGDRSRPRRRHGRCSGPAHAASARCPAIARGRGPPNRPLPHRRAPFPPSAFATGARATSARASACSRSAPIARWARSTPRWRWRPACARRASTPISRHRPDRRADLPGAASPSDAVGLPDFISGAVEWISAGRRDPNHWDLIGGAGARCFRNPSFSPAVSLGPPATGAQPDAFRRLATSQHPHHDAAA